MFFSPDFLRRVWFVAPLKSQATVPDPDTFFLRPALYREKFPQERQDRGAIRSRHGKNQIAHLLTLGHNHPRIVAAIRTPSLT